MVYRLQAEKRKAAVNTGMEMPVAGDWHDSQRWKRMLEKKNSQGTIRLGECPVLP